jgi:branched-chain amino acid transport system substrate-binding protein
LKDNIEQQEKRRLPILLHRIRRNFILILIGSTVAINQPLVLTQGEERVFYNNVTVNVTAAIAVAFAAVTIYRQKLDGLYGKTYLSLTIGLGLWLAAEITWTYFEIGLEIDTPFPSVADVFWLTGYGFFAYPLYRIYIFVGKNAVRQPAVLIVSITTAIALGYLVNAMIGASEISHSQEQKADDILLMLVSISYPILDGVLLVPAILILWSIRNGKLVVTHWMLIALSMIFVGIADSGFGYMAVSNINSVQEADWIWDILYNTGYLSIAFALVWYNRFFVFNEKKEQKKWQERNR